MEERCRVGVFCYEGIVFVGEVPHHSSHAHDLSPLEFVYERYSVEYFSIHVPVDVERRIPVVEELHVVHEREGAFRDGVREVGRWHDEQREWHPVPLRPSLESDVEFSPTVEPEALVDAQFGKVVLVLPVEQSVEAHGV